MSMSDTVAVALIASLASIIVATINYVANRKSRKTLTKLMHDQDLRIKVLEATREDQNLLIVQLREWGTGLESMISDLKEWANNLCCQVKQLGGEPVEFERNRGEKTQPRPRIK